MCRVAGRGLVFVMSVSGCAVLLGFPRGLGGFLLLLSRDDKRGAQGYGQVNVSRKCPG